VQCFAGHQQWFGFLGLWSPPAAGGSPGGDSYLLQYGDWFPKEGGDDPAFQFVDALHGALVHWVGKRITLFVTTTNAMSGEVVPCIRIRPTVPVGKARPAPAETPPPAEDDEDAQNRAGSCAERG
jgi:hypothetical protein